jgi:hypothetical protein
MCTEDKDVIDEAIGILKGAANCDGAHHKQYDIVRALKVLMGPRDFDLWTKQLENEYDCVLDEGIP